MKYAFVRIANVACLIILTSCAETTIEIKSSTPARIELMGHYFCHTPCRKEIDWDLHPQAFEAFPLDKSQGTTQRKNVQIFEHEENSVYFDMESSLGIDTEQSKKESGQRIEKKVVNLEERKEKELKFLKEMHEKGNIDEQMYKDLVQKVIEKK